MSLLIDETAKARLSSLHEDDKATNKILLIDLIHSGCSGWAYHFSWLVSAEQSKKELTLTEIQYDGNSFNVAYPSLYEDYFNGSILKYQTEGLNTRLIVDNPNVKSECGCGESINFDQ